MSCRFVTRNLSILKGKQVHKLGFIATNSIQPTNSMMTSSNVDLTLCGTQSSLEAKIKNMSKFQPNQAQSRSSLRVF